MIKIEDILFSEKYKSLTLKEIRILSILSKNSGSMVNVSDIEKSVFNGVFCKPKTIEVHLSNMRRKLKPIGYTIMGRCGQYILLPIRIGNSIYK